MNVRLEDLGRVHEAEVLVVGGGNAGINAAISAREEGADVLVVEKSDPARSGSIGGGVDHFLAYLETGPDWDSREGFLQWVTRVARGAVDLRFQNEVYCKGGRDATMARYAKVGSPLHQPDGSYYRTQSYGQPGPYWINFNGKHLKFNLFRYARKLRARMLSHVVVTGLLTKGEQVIGCVGVNPRSGEFHICTGRAIVLATGNTNRMYKNHTPYRFNTWQCPANTGAAQALAFQAGAALANMEYMRWTVVPKGFSAAGLNALSGMGGKLINGHGEPFMSRYHPMGEKAPRFKIVEAVYTEIVEGRGPVYIDCRHLDPRDLSHLRDLLGWDKDTLPDYIEQMGVDLTRDPLEVMFSEGLQSGPSEVCASGIMIDTDCMSTIPGVFAAGDCADQTRCLHLCSAGGARAGAAAARWVAGRPGPPPAVDVEQVARLKDYTFAPLRVQGGFHYTEIEDEISRVMWQNVGPTRSEQSLLAADRMLDDIHEKLDAIRAGDFHELMRAHEVKTMWQVAKVTTNASLHRKESRFGVYFRRTDYPETREEYTGQMVCRREGERGVNVTFRPLSYDIPPL